MGATEELHPEEKGWLTAARLPGSTHPTGIRGGGPTLRPRDKADCQAGSGRSEGEGRMSSGGDRTGREEVHMERNTLLCVHTLEMGAQEHCDTAGQHRQCDKVTLG